MDEQTIFNLLECSVCLEPLDVTSRVLPCQHTFCMRCLQQIINTRNELKCPECRELVPCRTVTDLPTNILLVRLLDGLKRSGGKAPGSPPPRTSNASVGVSAVGGEAVLSAGRGITGKNSIQNQPCAMALYKYEAQEHGDLSFNKSDIILLHKRIDDNWYQGVVMGATDQTMGFFPSSYVQVLTPLPPDPPQCKALYDFEVNEREEKDCLTFNKDEVLNVIRRVDENWVEGQKGDKIGIFPLSFVELNGTAKALVDAHAGVDASSGPFHQSQGSGDAGSSPDQAGSSQEGGSKNKVKRHSFTSLLGLSTSAQNKNKDSQPSTTTSASTGNAASTSTSSNTSGSSSNRHSLEISSPVLVRSSNPTAANLIDSKAVASGASQQAAAGGPAAAVVSAGAAGVAGNAAETSATGRKKPAPLTGISQMPASGPRGPNSPSMAASPTVTQAGNAEFRFVGEAPSSPKPKVEVYVAMYSYKQTKADEIELKKGDFYTVTEKCKDGWFKGMAVKTGDLGVFPGNYMQAYRTSRKTATTAPESRPLQSTPAATSSTGQNIRPRLPSDAATRGTSSRVVSNEAPRSPSPAQGMRPRVMSDASTRFAPQRAAAVRTVEAVASTKEISAASNPVSLSSATTQTTISRTGSNPSRATQPNQTAVSVQSDRKTASQIPDGQKTVAQLQSERAAQLLQYRPPPPNYPVRPGHSSVGQARVNATPHPDRTLRGSPPTVGTQTVTTSTRTSTGQVQGGASGAQSVASQPQGVQNRQPVPMSVRLRASSGQAVVGSPPMHNGIAQRVRSPSSPQPNAQDSSIAGDGGGVSGKPRGSPVMGQGLPRGSSAITSTALPQSTPPQVEVHVSNKNKRHSAQIPATVTELQARQPVVKPRRHSESDNDPVRSRRTVQPKMASHQHPPQCNAQLQTLISSSNSNSQQPGTASPNTKQTIAVSSTGNAVQQSHSKPSSPSVYRVSDILPLAAPTPNATAAPDCVVPSLASSGKADKKEKKDRKVAKKRPQGSPEDGAPVPLARGSSLPNGQDAANADSSRPHSPGPSLTASAAVSAPQGEASAEDASVVLGAEGTSESAVDRRDKPPKTTPLVRERYRVTAPYPPNTDAELELKVGDTVFVHSKRDDGWFKGTQQRTGKMGLFPGSFVESY